jgi:hypothetical protein
MLLLLGAVLETIALFVLFFYPGLAGLFFVSVPVLFLPIILCRARRRSGRLKVFRYLNPDEKSFDEVFKKKR